MWVMVRLQKVSTMNYSSHLLLWGHKVNESQIFKRGFKQWRNKQGGTVLTERLSTGKFLLSNGEKLGKKKVKKWKREEEN